MHPGGPGHNPSCHHRRRPLTWPRCARQARWHPGGLSGYAPQRRGGAAAPVLPARILPGWAPRGPCTQCSQRGPVCRGTLQGRARWVARCPPWGAAPVGAEHPTRRVLWAPAPSRARSGAVPVVTHRRRVVGRWVRPVPGVQREKWGAGGGSGASAGSGQCGAGARPPLPLAWQAAHSRPRRDRSQPPARLLLGTDTVGLGLGALGASPAWHSMAPHGTAWHSIPSPGM